MSTTKFEKKIEKKCVIIFENWTKLGMYNLFLVGL